MEVRMLHSKRIFFVHLYVTFFQLKIDTLLPRIQAHAPIPGVYVNQKSE